MRDGKLWITWKPVSGKTAIPSRAGLVWITNQLGDFHMIKITEGKSEQLGFKWCNDF